MVGPGIGSLLSAVHKLREALYPIMLVVVLLLAWLLSKPCQDNFDTYTLPFVLVRPLWLPILPPLVDLWTAAPPPPAPSLAYGARVDGGYGEFATSGSQG